MVNQLLLLSIVCLASMLMPSTTDAFAPSSSSPLLSSISIDTNLSSKVEISRRSSRSSSGSTSSSSLYFGVPTFGGGEKDKKENDDDENGINEGFVKKEIGMLGFFQLLTAGLGAPFLGDYQGVDEDTGKFMFSLDANNLVDENGESKQTKMPYFENGWVDEEDAEKEKQRNEKKKGGGFKFW
uniref:Uncharacterized protein n=1 Tax=Eucampia antarctica TaxID=49252 RepID=A0A7S2S1J4_9STRA|mmetsp:Transcript_29716/g.28573  ORF Transcript_29716/g.28573 Transcript_29716/m.28573 type:complete len:183 (+) Transcript_29716:83-631(+)|eukprot:CAMPEP_0197832988 /NCGR_PEP_ID=MMETSP1437-20131217/17219_1 /TAXON_ID=49252 ORGANISM="Eucampia antarctica, Strain CCMP1452" /NCGR_SAMPLE_ID=MMETSP1437 /ASSEMBLY_ACC=CAM_ASM_001096 /LENGTH=182 /DNA_ID=CAMNT_0043436701 /DNA_START=56 /DNA_END=601 /DNA_ORIENTATION=-